MQDILRLLKYAKPFGGILILAILLSASIGIFEAGRTALIQPILDGLGDSIPSKINITSSEPINIPTLNWHKTIKEHLPSGKNYWYSLLGIMLGITFLRGVGQFFSNYLLSYVSQGIILRLRQDLYTHLLTQSSVFFKRHRTADLITRIISDIEKMQLAISIYLADLLREGFTLISLFCLALYLSWKLTLVSILVVPFIAWITMFFSKRLRSASRITQEGLQEVIAITQETLKNHQIVKSFTAENFEEQRLFVASKKLRNANLRTARAQFLPSPLMDILGVCIGAIIILYTQNLIASGLITVGGFTATLFALLRLYDPIRKLSQTHNSYSQVAAASARVFQLLDEHTETIDSRNAINCPRIPNSIKFSNLTFTYPEAAAPALQNISFTIKKGQMVALVGPSGAGKSTLLNLLLRFYNPITGNIFIDDIDITDIKLKSLRSQIAFVSQDVLLFQSSFINNLAYSNPMANIEKIKQSAILAHANDFIMERGGYDVYIGEGGNELSGGQRQRIAIARALFKNAPILLLDEATSALDTESEHKIQQAIENLTRERTTLVIAHRLSTIKRADRILVMDKGCIVEEGTSEELMAVNGLYKRLYDMQFTEL